MEKVSKQKYKWT